jgi:quercetin dioxygenase-like cupin family protein
MRRHRALVPLSHEHHRALVTARRARSSAEGPPDVRLAAARAFLVFFDGHASGHFREEEEHIFPLLLASGLEPPDELGRALVEHTRLRSLATRMRLELAAESVPGATLQSAGELLEGHVRFEERVLFPMIEERAAATLDALDDPPTRDAPLADDQRDGVVDLARPVSGRGPQGGMQSVELNATLLAWPPGEGFAEHRNSERDVLLVVLDGTAVVRLDDTDHQLGDHQLLLLPRGSLRALTAGDNGVRYLSIHRRRDPLLPRARR